MIYYIPAAGLGKRAEKYTKDLHKTIYPVDHISTLGRILKMIEIDDEVIISVGNKGDQIIEFIKTIYPERKIKIHRAYKENEEPISLTDTILKAKKNLNGKEFIIIPSDTFINDKLNLKKDEVIVKTCLGKCTEYRHITIENIDGTEKIKFLDKRKNSKKRKYCYSGIAHISDSKKFFQTLEKENNELSEINYLMKSDVKLIEKSWYDVGNIIAVKLIIKESKYNILDKEDEYIGFENNKVWKYSKTSQKKIANRSKLLSPYSPIMYCKSKFLVYKMEDGITLSNLVNRKINKKLLNHLSNFWELDGKNINKESLNFYKNKTLERVRLLEKQDIKKIENIEIINKIQVEKIGKIIKKIDFEKLSCYSKNTKKWHGDLHYENILLNKSRFILLDHRSSFDKLTTGDIYYEFAKLLHGIIINHRAIRENNYSINISDGEIEIKIDKYKDIISILKDTLMESKKYGLEEEILATHLFLVLINIAPLHHKPYQEFLVSLAKMVYKYKDQKDGIIKVVRTL